MICFTDEDIIQAAFKYYRRTGFPYPKLARYERIHVFRKLQGTKAKINKQKANLFGTKARAIQVQSVGDIALANFYHKHIWESHAMGMHNPIESFAVDIRLKKVMRLCLEYNGEITRKRVNIYMRTVNGTQMCSNFRPTAAKAIYDYFKCNSVLDMCTGYGGRLLGFLASNCKGMYYGVDPNKKTCKCNRLIAKDFHAENRVKIICSAFEDVKKIPKIGLAFTSPPYFSKEIYEENNPSQSRDKFVTYKEWINGFLRPMIKNTGTALYPNGILAMNVGNIKIRNKSYPLIKDTVSIATRNGFTLVEQLELVLPGFGRGLAKRKFEPVLIFRKMG